MGTVYKKTATKPVPRGAELFTKNGKRFACWKPSKGKARTAPVMTGNDGTDRIVVTVGTYLAKFRDGSGLVCEVSTGCRDEDAARSVLGKLERRAELVKSEVLSKGESAMADHQATSIADHFAAYLNHVQAKGATADHIADLKRKAKRLFKDCAVGTLRDIDAEVLEGWMTARQIEKMAARTRNTYLQAVRGFCKWCVETERLASNPLARIAKADEKSDRRRQRRAMTEAELMTLLQVARMRPLAEYGRKSVPVDEGEAEAEATSRPPERSKWTYSPLTLDGMQRATELARKRLQDSPAFLDEREQLGRERALIYKTLVLTGLRKNELASLTIGQLCLDEEMSFAVLNAADEKNRQGSTIPLRTDLAAELRDWIIEKRARFQERPDEFGRERLFIVPAGLVRILNRDLLAAGIKKCDERGRTVDVHALRTSFGTLLSKGGVAPRTAQAAMRHSKIDLTMGVYTDPKLLDVYGALDTLPSLDLDTSPSTERQTMRATGTDDRDALAESRHAVTKFAPAFAPNSGKRGQAVSFAVISSDDDDERTARRANNENRLKPSKKALPAVFASKAYRVETTGIEPATSGLQSQRSPS
jgi:integrase